MKESRPFPRKVVSVRAVSYKIMAADKEKVFNDAIDALLAELVCKIDQHQGQLRHGDKDKQMAA